MLMWNVLLCKSLLWLAEGTHVNAAIEDVCPRSQEVQTNFEGALLLAKLSSQE